MVEGQRFVPYDFTMEVAIQIQGLCKSYGDFNALQSLDFSVDKGQCVGLLGSNGAGKSTTIRMIIGQLKPTSGHVRVFGVDPSRNPKEVHQHIGYIPDSQSLYDELSVNENVLVFAKLFGYPQSHVDDILRQIDLIKKKNEQVKSLSKGLRQRVLIARALVHKPKIIILDEPTTGLDPNSAESIYQILENLKKKGATLLLTTHLMNDVERLCDTITFLDKGKKIEEGTPWDLKKKYGDNKIIARIVGSGGEEDVILNHSEKWTKQLSDIAQQSEILSIHSSEPKLEEIFIKLVESTK